VAAVVRRVTGAVRMDDVAAGAVDERKVRVDMIIFGDYLAERELK